MAICDRSIEEVTMFVAEWSFDVKYGMRDEAMRMLMEQKASFKAIPGWKAKRTRVLGGSVGCPESRFVLEHEFATLADLESSWDWLHQNAETFKKLTSQLKNFVIDGSPRWEVYRVIDGG
jgi:hypothetical protein